MNWSFTIVTEGPVRPLSDGRMFPKAASVTVFDPDETRSLVAMRLKVLPQDEVDSGAWRGKPALTELMVGPAPRHIPGNEARGSQRFAA